MRHTVLFIAASLLFAACSDAHDATDASVHDAGADAGPLLLRCQPDSVPSSGFVQNEVYVESSSSSCAGTPCMVFHLVGNPLCSAGDPRCTGPDTSACFDGSIGRSLCVDADTPEIQLDDASPDRAFCTCRCGASGNASLPLCACPDRSRCIPDTDPGGGYCVRDALALLEGVCETDAECATAGTTCDATHHCR